MAIDSITEEFVGKAIEEIDAAYNKKSSEESHDSLKEKYDAEGKLDSLNPYSEWQKEVITALVTLYRCGIQQGIEDTKSLR